MYAVFISHSAFDNGIMNYPFVYMHEDWCITHGLVPKI